MALDGDEFPNVKIGNGMVGYLIDACPDADQILVNWRNFGSSGQLDLSDELVISRYRLAEPKDDIQNKRPSGFKSLFKSSSFQRPGIHRAKIPLISQPKIRNALA